LCVSNYIRRQLIEQAGIAQAQTTIVHNGIDPDVFRMRDLEENGRETEANDRVRLLYAGRLVPEKGAHVAIEAMGLLYRRKEKLSVTLTVLGSGRPEYEWRLKQLVAELNLEDCVHFRGQVPREAMPRILAKHDVLVLPSVWQEPLARMTQEAMACGLVVIGTTTGGTPEILHDGENGFTFAAEDAAMLAEKIRIVAADRGLRKRIASAARRTIEERFSMTRMVDQIERYFSRVVAASNRAEINILE
jgi:glycosyltransferase involved in cell wall biosynthesis